MHRYLPRRDTMFPDLARSGGSPFGRCRTRDRVLLLLSFKAGLRAREIALATWMMVPGADGAVGDALDLRDAASNGRGGGRAIPLNAELRTALAELHAERKPAPRDRIAALGAGDPAGGPS